MKNLLFGLGNPILTDDGVGIRVVERLRGDPALAGIDLETGALGGLAVLDSISGYERVVIVDAVKTDGGVPGTVTVLSPADLPSTSRTMNPHDCSLLEALGFAERTGLPVPRAIRIAAIEIVEDRVFGETLSPTLADRFEAIVDEVRREALAFLRG